ncbi:MAG: choice-of-anchor B family protein [Saprospiraceae bacterium]|nr:choice-of-anchor B family protein [Saprospiraceae bacterium]
MKTLLYSFFILFAFQLNAQVSQFNLLGTWSNDTLPASSAHNNTYNEVWGITNAGREYAIIGSTYGTHFIDVTDPNDPTEVYVVEGGTTGRSIIHRDFHDLNGYLYAVADEGAESTLQIMDCSFLPDSVQLVYDSKEFIRRSHNIFIDSSTSIMYSCISAGDLAPWTPLRLFDVSDPTQPTIIASYSEFDGYRISQVHDMYIRDNIAYLNCGPSGFVVADFTDPMAPQTLSILEPSEYEQSGYNHSGWLSEDGSTYFMADENHGADIKVIDVTGLPELNIIDTIDPGTHPLSIPHNQIVMGDLLFSSYYYDGLQVWDISDPSNITRIIEYSTSNIDHRLRYEGAWGVYPFLPSGVVLVSDMQEGLFVLEFPVSAIEETALEHGDFKIYPNPSQGQLKIESIENDKIELVNVYNAEGYKVMSLSPDSNYTLDLTDGVYFLHIQSEGFTRFKKLIIAH